MLTVMDHMFGTFILFPFVCSCINMNRPVLMKVGIVNRDKGRSRFTSLSQYAIPLRTNSCEVTLSLEGKGGE